MAITFDDLKSRFGSLNTDPTTQAIVSIENENIKEDTFLASWKYPVKNSFRETQNYIRMTYRFMMDIEQLKLLWQKSYKQSMPEGAGLNRIIEYTFFELAPYLYDFNGKGDDYEQILKLLYASRGFCLKEFGMLL